MEFRQLEYFIAVAEELSFARAAGKLNISQPAVSRQIALLESELNTALFDVTRKVKHKQVVLTEEGSYFYQEAVKILRQSKEMTEGLERLRSRRKAVNVGYCTGMPQEGLVGVLDFLQHKLPEFELKLTAFSSTYEMEEALRKDEVHFGTGLDTGSIPPGLEALPVFEGHVQVCISARNPLSQKDSLNVHELKNEKWVGGLIRPEDRVTGRGSRSVPDFGHLAALAELDMGLGPVPSFYSFAGPAIRQVDLFLEGKPILCRQTLLFKKSNPSFLVRKVQGTC